MSGWLQRRSAGAVSAVAGALVLGLALAGQARAESGDKNHGASDKPAIGQAAPDFTLKDVDGKEVKLADYRGKIVVLHFQSMNCPWDAGYQPILDKVASGYQPAKTDKAADEPKDAGKPEVVFLAINANHNEKAEDLKAYHDKAHMTYPILKDAGNKVADAYAAQTTPHMFVIDEKGVLRYKGGVEKAPVSPKDVGKSKEQYLGPVLDALTQGKEPPYTSTQSHGCTIKRERA